MICSGWAFFPMQLDITISLLVKRWRLNFHLLVYISTHLEYGRIVKQLLYFVIQSHNWMFDQFKTYYKWGFCNRSTHYLFHWVSHEQTNPTVSRTAFSIRSFETGSKNEPWTSPGLLVKLYHQMVMREATYKSFKAPMGTGSRSLGVVVALHLSQ